MTQGSQGNTAEQSVRASAVLNALSLGTPLTETAERLSRYPRTSVGREDVESAIRDALAALRNDALLPSVEAGFRGARFLLPRCVKREERVPPTATVPCGQDLAELRAAAERLLEEYLTSGSVPADLRDAELAPSGALAMQFARRLLLQKEGIQDLADAAADPASLHHDLTPSDRARVEASLLNRERFATLDELTADWRGLVESLATRPSSWLYEEYEDRLIRRDRLEDAVSLASPSSRTRIDSVLRPEDERFFEVTRGVGSSVATRDPWVPQRWWWFRVPAEPADAFLEMLDRRAPLVAAELRGEDP